MRTAGAAVALAVALTLAHPLDGQDMPEGSPEALRAYAEGLEHYVRGENDLAYPSFIRAHDIDPNFQVALILAGTCSVNLGNAAQADSLFKQVKTESLSEYYRLRMQATSETYVRGNPEEALVAGRRLAQLAPGTKAVYNHALYAQRVNRQYEGRSVILALDPTREPILSYAPYWNVLFAAFHMTGDLEKALDAAQRGRKAFPDLPTPAGNTALALAALGRTAELDALLPQIEQLYAGAGFGGLLTNLGGELAAHGHAQAGTQMAQRAVQWFEPKARAAGATPAMRSGYAWALYQAGRAADAQPILASLAEGAPDNIAYHGMLGAAAAKAGDRRTAQQADAWLASTKRPYVFGDATEWRGFIAGAQGDAARAAALLQQALKEGLVFNGTWHRDATFRPLVSDPALQRVLAPRDQT